MSLTSRLRQPGSPIGVYIDRVAPGLVATRGGSNRARNAADRLGLLALESAPLIVRPPTSSDASRTGTAFDIRTRIELGGFDVDTSTAKAGFQTLSALAGVVDNGARRAAILKEAFATSSAAIASSADARELDRAVTVLAIGEQLFRAGPQAINALNGPLGDQCDRAADGHDFIGALDSRALLDLRSLMEMNREQLEAWRTEIRSGARLVGNPAFAGAPLVGGADGDWIFGDTLFDCKVYREPSVPKLIDALRQLLGYVLLDLDDAQGIRRVGVWLPRQSRVATWSLDELLGDDAVGRLPALRDGFANATRGDQIALHTPAAERRKLQLLADNRHTPFEWLDDLAAHDDVAIRYRVARNPVSPHSTLSRLTRDRSAQVREWTAKNPSTPRHLLLNLADDLSIVVRRAAAAALLLDTAELAPSPSDEGESSAVAQRKTNRGAVTGSAARWVESYLRVLFGAGLSPYSGEYSERHWTMPLPKSSLLWSWKTGEAPLIPPALRGPLPEHVQRHLLGAAQPANIRQLVALYLDSWDVAMLRSMLTDPDEMIALAALVSTSSSTNDELRGVIAEFARPIIDRRAATPPRDLGMLQQLAAHPLVEPGLLQALSSSGNVSVLLALLSNPSLEADVRSHVERELIADRAVETREVLSAAHRTPASVLAALARDRLVRVRLGVAGHRSTPPDALADLAKDRDPDVQEGVLFNPSTPSEVASRLATELLESANGESLISVLDLTEWRSDLVVDDELIKDALDRLSKSRSDSERARSVVAGDHRTRPKTLTRLASSAYSDVRQVCAANPATPEIALGRLSRDEDATVRRAAAKSTALRESQLQLLLADEDDGVREAARQNPSATELVVASADREDEPRIHARGLSIAQLHEMAASRRAEIRMQAAYSTEATPDVLALLAGERRSVQVRRAVAANPNTPAEVLDSLTSDDDPDLRRALAFNNASPPALLTRLAEESVDLALLTALNAGAPRAHLEMLASDVDPLVAHVATVLQSERPDEIEKGDSGVLALD